MSYQAVAIYSLDGTFVGYGIKDDRVFKLQSTNLWEEYEQDKLQARLNELNADVDIRAFWPHPKDPDVLALLDNPEFMPIEYVPAEVVDDDRSYYVWKQEPEVDEYGQPTGRVVQGSELDEEASVIRYTTAMVPKNPSDQLVRIKAASEVVARQRAGLA